MTSTGYCPFCRRVEGSEWLVDYGQAVAFAPLSPVTRGHLLVVPVAHVADAAEDLQVTADTFRAAAELARDVGDCNLITSVGAGATQTVMHLHVHVVPRTRGDGLHLPWTGQVLAR